MAYTFGERRRIHREALRRLGKRMDPQDRADFMQNCIEEVMSGDEIGEGNEEDARTICEMLWEQEQNDAYADEED